MGQVTAYLNVNLIITRSVVMWPVVLSSFSMTLTVGLEKYEMRSAQCPNTVKTNKGCNHKLRVCILSILF